MSGNRIRIGLLGAGYIADWHGRALRTVPGAELVAVCDQNERRAREFAHKWGVRRVETSLDAMLAARELDAVHVLLPPPAHAASACSILDAGISAYLEKPLCVSPEECDELVRREALGQRIGVGHNFLFDPRYEQLRLDLADGKLGRVEHVRIVWAKEFGAARTGPFGSWVFRSPAHVLLEVGPHPVAHLLDLLGGPPDRLRVECLDPVNLPGGGVFFQRWLVWAFREQKSAELRLSFGAGFPEHCVEVRGAAGTAVVDYDRLTYVLRRRTALADDFDRYARTVSEGAALRRQARSSLTRYVLSKVGMSREGNAFGLSIARSIQRFYHPADGQNDSRLGATFSADVVRTCLDIARAAGLDSVPKVSLRPVLRAASPAQADVLVLGGTGFIGRELVRQLIAVGQRVRVLVRDPQGIAADLNAAGVDVRVGDLQRRDDLAPAVDGADAVVHLARSQSRTWADYERTEIQVARNVGEVCLAAGVKRLVYTGTTDSYYSGRAETITEETPLDPKLHRRNLYARAKAESEHVLLGLRNKFQLPLVILRPAIVIGAGGDPHHWGVGFWPSPGTCLLWGEGNHPVPLVLVNDVADAIVRCLSDERVIGETFNLAADPCLSAREYVTELAAAWGTWIDVRSTPVWRFFANEVFKWGVKCLVRHPERRLPSYRDWKSRSYHARYDCSKAKRVFGWSPISDKATLIAQGIWSAAQLWHA